MKFDYTQQPGLIRWKRSLISDGKPLISIITAFYNAGKYFRQTYHCVIDQTFPWFEWIIVDDGSTDEKSLELLNELALTDSRIKIIHQANAGTPSARNTGIMNSSTDYIFPLDSDDLIEPTCLEYNYWALYFNPKASWSYSDSVGFQGEEYLWDVPFDPERMKLVNHLAVTALIRKKAALDVGCYSVKKIPFDEDWHFWLKLLAAGAFPVQIKGEHLFWYRRGETGVFASIHNDPKRARENEKIIEEQAAFVISPEKPVIYPCNSDKAYTLPSRSSWNRTLYREHNKIHILCLFPWLAMGNANKFNLDLLTGLNKERYEISIITTTQSDNAWIQRFREITPEIFNLPNFLSPEHYPEFIDYYIKTREIDIIFQSNSLDGYYLLPWIRKNFPTVAIIDYIHMEEWHCRNDSYARDSAIMGNLIEHTYVCDSTARDIMIKKFHKNPKMVDAVHIGIDEEYFRPECIRQNLLYKELNIGSDRPIVLVICPLHPQKRSFLMLKIAQQVKKQIENVAFVVIGDGPQASDLRSAAQSMDLSETVYFLGARNEVRPYYRDSKLTLICGMKEDLDLTAYESCAMGVPVISANIGNQKDLIDNTVGALIPYMQDKKNVFDSRTFPTAEITAYTNAIIEILSDDEKWNTLSRNCRQKIKKSFTIHAMIEKMDSEFQRIANDSSLLIDRKKKSDALNQLGLLAGELFTVNLTKESALSSTTNTYNSTATDNSALLSRLNEYEKILNRHEEVVNRHEEVINRHEEVVNRHEEVVNRHETVINRHEEVVNRHEEVVNRHEEVVNRHEEVVNRHETVINRHEEIINQLKEIVNRYDSSINHQCEVQKWHEKRLQELESNVSLAQKIKQKFL